MRKRFVASRSGRDETTADSITPAGALDWIRRALEGLAKPADQQLQGQPPDFPTADDLALELYSAWECRSWAIGAGLINGVQEEAIAKVDRLLDEMSGAHQEWLWSDDALRHHPLWNRVRALASEALLELNR